MLELVLLGIAIGFGGKIVHRFRSREQPYPPIVHIHPMAFVGRLVLPKLRFLLIGWSGDHGPCGTAYLTLSRPGACRQRHLAATIPDSTRYQLRR